jgi:hypothetical protein
MLVVVKMGMSVYITLSLVILNSCMRLNGIDRDHYFRQRKLLADEGV